MPALMAKPSLGVAISGGGYRATVCGLGWLRALERRGALSQSRYLASNSGGSWLNGALSYTQVPWPVFFGAGPPPEDMAWEGVREGAFLPRGSYGRAVEQGTIVAEAIGGVVGDALTPDSVAQVKGWSDSVDTAFLMPFGVGAHGSSVTALGAGAGPGVVGKAKGAAAAARAPTNATEPTPGLRRRRFRSLFQTAAAAEPAAPPTTKKPAARPTPLLGVAGPVATRVAAQAPAIPFMAAAGTPDRPFPILVGSMLAPNTTHPYRPVEFTPLYVATPGRDPPAVEGELGGGKDGTGKADPQAAAGGTYPPVGGMAIEPLGLNSYPPPAGTVPRASPAGAATIEARSRFVVPLATMVGVSSSFVAQGLRPEGDAAEDLTGTETLWYWAPSRDGRGFEGREWGFADGGGVDNTAIIPLLRRGVRRIVAGTASSVAADNAKTNATAWAASQWDVAGLFGAVPREAPGIKRGRVNGMRVDDFNAFMQVFETGGYERLYGAISAAVAEGRPATYRLKAKVLPNAWQGVEGGYDVDLLWLFNQPCAEFERALPAETRDALGGARRDDKTDKQQKRAGGAPDLKTFPMISTFNADYSAALTTLLSGQSEWQANQALDQIDELVAAAVAEREAGAKAKAKAGAAAAAAKPRVAEAKNNATLVAAAAAAADEVLPAGAKDATVAAAAAAKPRAAATTTAAASG